MFYLKRIIVFLIVSFISTPFHSTASMFEQSVLDEAKKKLRSAAASSDQNAPIPQPPPCDEQKAPETKVWGNQFVISNADLLSTVTLRKAKTNQTSLWREQKKAIEDSFLERVKSEKIEEREVERRRRIEWMNIQGQISEWKMSASPCMTNRFQGRYRPKGEYSQLSQKVVIGKVSRYFPSVEQAILEKANDFATRDRNISMKNLENQENALLDMFYLSMMRSKYSDDETAHSTRFAPAVAQAIVSKALEFQSHTEENRFSHLDTQYNLWMDHIYVLYLLEKSDLGDGFGESFEPSKNEPFEDVRLSPIEASLPIKHILIKQFSSFPPNVPTAIFHYLANEWQKLMLQGGELNLSSSSCDDSHASSSSSVPTHTDHNLSLYDLDILKHLGLTRLYMKSLNDHFEKKRSSQAASSLDPSASLVQQGVDMSMIVVPSEETSTYTGPLGEIYTGSYSTEVMHSGFDPTAGPKTFKYEGYAFIQNTQEGQRIIHANPFLEYGASAYFSSEDRLIIDNRRSTLGYYFTALKYQSPLYNRELDNKSPSNKNFFKNESLFTAKKAISEQSSRLYQQEHAYESLDLVAIEQSKLKYPLLKSIPCSQEKKVRTYRAGVRF